MNKHTPSPWKWSLSRTVWHLHAPQSSRGGLLISAPKDRAGEDHSEDVANRLLIEAAPDLLAACEAAHKYLHDYPRSDPGALVAIISAAIAKAKGKA